MATMVGKQKELSDLLYSLIELDLDAVTAYEAAIEKLSDAGVKTQLGRFLNDHERHVAELVPELEKLGKDAPKGPDVKAVLAKGKVVIGGIFGDRAILSAMKTNEDDTNTAYERACDRHDLTPLLSEILKRGLSDERRHRRYIEDCLAVQGREHHVTR